MEQVNTRKHSPAALHEKLKACLAIADELKLDMISPHIDLAIARLEELMEGTSVLGEAGQESVPGPTEAADEMPVPRSGAGS